MNVIHYYSSLCPCGLTVTSYAGCYFLFLNNEKRKQYSSVVIRLMMIKTSTLIFLNLAHSIKSLITSQYFQFRSLFCWKSVLCTTHVKSNHARTYTFLFCVLFCLPVILFLNKYPLGITDYFYCFMSLSNSAPAHLPSCKKAQPFLSGYCPFFRALHLGIQFSLYPVSSIFEPQQQLTQPPLKSSILPLRKIPVFLALQLGVQLSPYSRSSPFGTEQ